MKNSSIKTVVAVGIGAALFFVLGRFVYVPLALIALIAGAVLGGIG